MSCNEVERNDKEGAQAAETWLSTLVHLPP